ncbi:seryl-tRNA synthetase [Segniliparus rotundus DSM 44985]|uniref:Serine--tRNA ligase n=1 Tax=Segniliparus rotundus (strain ATCC BAA-972 / CDC 1076 / CIP 108378 / DSM 44985 / JCM 13578) TaxID=640132 RepID=D6ZCP5_SEGRD|nr:serine--tRNA ligase [Segniliparus rotundus]ADG97087.1 seryl-tRNA synthetase [Segniliparus rotundus DSM 44985]
MHDLDVLLTPEAAAKLARRGYQLDIARLESLREQRKALRRQADELRAQVRALGKAGKDAVDKQAHAEHARAVKEQVRETEAALDELEAALRAELLTIPNLPSDAAPEGLRESDYQIVRVVGEQQTFDPAEYPDGPKDHVALGEQLGILDLGRAVKLSGPRFSFLKGQGARLERALASFFLDLHTREHGYEEFSVPLIVGAQTLTGSGQLPKFGEDLFKIATGEPQYLIPTAEVPLVNYYAGEFLGADALPIAATAHSSCFRSEAGSYGRDTKGILRQHQFSKVELVRVVLPEHAQAQQELMLGHAERCLRELGLHYRVIDLPAGDLGFTAERTFDIEAWLPSQNAYREISSVSSCADFQSRRNGLRVKGKDGERIWPATLNGSALPIGRTVIAILEQFQQPDGSVLVPEALRGFMGADALRPV